MLLRAAKTRLKVVVGMGTSGIAAGRARNPEGFPGRDRKAPADRDVIVTQAGRTRPQLP